MKHIYAYLEPDACTGCLTCELACEARTPSSEAILAAMVSDPHPPTRIYVEAGWDTESKVVPVPIFCHQCEDAPCMKVCPVDAITEDEEYHVMSLDSDSCIGCRECMMACPFGALTLDHDGKVVKCDLCMDRLRNNENPACVESCPQGILKYLEDEEYSEDIKQNHVEQILESLRYARERAK